VTRVAVLVVAGLLALMVTLEVAAVPIAERLVTRAMERCVVVESVAIASTRRPVLPRLVVGRARDVELVATGIELEGLRVERARIRSGQVVLPWAPFPPAAPPPAELELTVTEQDLATWLEARAPLGMSPVLELTPGVAAVGVAPLPARVRLEVAVRDRIVRVAPVGRVPAWFARLGLDLAFELPDDVRLDDLVVEQGRVAATLAVDAVAGVDGSGGCAGPLADRADADVAGPRP
jgi:hypothetical protein